MAISFVTILLSLTMVVSVVITPVVAAPVVAAPVVVVVIAVVVELTIIIVGRVSAIVIIASVSSWIGTRSYVVSVIIIAYVVV
jgi:hypothetical protein